MNRIKQIKETLPKNLQDNILHKSVIEFILVDFSSSDGLQKWIFENFQKELKQGYLKYYYTDDLLEWNASIAKNTSALLTTGKIIVNLDCDNYTGEHGGLWIIEKFQEYGDNLLLHQSSNIYKSGTMGRISMIKDNFLKLNGYNEQLFSMSVQDKDIIERGKLIGLNYINYNLNNNAIINDKDKSLENSNYINYNKMCKINTLISNYNIINNIYKANNLKKDYKIGIQNITRLFYK